MVSTICVISYIYACGRVRGRALDPGSAPCIFCTILGELLDASELYVLHLYENDKCFNFISFVETQQFWKSLVI